MVRLVSVEQCQMRNVCHRIWKDGRYFVRFDGGVSVFHHHFQREFNLSRTCCSILQRPTYMASNINIVKYYWAFVSWNFLFIFYFCTFVFIYENVDARLSYHQMNAHWITNAAHYTLYIQQFSMISLHFRIWIIANTKHYAIFDGYIITFESKWEWFSFYTHVWQYLVCVTTQLTTGTIIFSSSIFYFSIVILLTRKCFVLFSKLGWKMFPKVPAWCWWCLWCLNAWTNEWMIKWKKK